MTARGFSRVSSRTEDLGGHQSTDLGSTDYGLARISTRSTWSTEIMCMRKSRGILSGGLYFNAGRRQLLWAATITRT